MGPSVELPLSERLSSLFDEEFGAESTGAQEGMAPTDAVPMSRFFRRLGPLVSQMDPVDRESLFHIMILNVRLMD